MTIKRCHITSNNDDNDNNNVQKLKYTSEKL